MDALTPTEQATSVAAGREWLAPALVLAIGLAAILGAWGSELIGHYVPCALCLEQRIPYYIGLPVALAATLAALAGARPAVSRGLLLIAGLILASGIYLGAYHAGVEWGFWPGPTDCSGGASLPTSTDDLLEALKRVRVVSCTEAAFRFPNAPWGLSFAGLNALASGLILAVALWGVFRRPGPNRTGRRAA